MKTDRGAFRAGRREQLMTPLREDSYREDSKLHQPAVCPDCGATFRKGRWTWEAAEAGAEPHRCPACRRIRDALPAGYVTLKGAFVAAHRAQIEALLRGCEAREKAEHPLQRIIAIADAGEGLQVTTTDGHLARGLAQALHEAFKGTVEVKYAKEENLVRAVWEREQ